MSMDASELSKSLCTLMVDGADHVEASKSAKKVLKETFKGQEIEVTYELELLCDVITRLVAFGSTQSLLSKISERRAIELEEMLGLAKSYEASTNQLKESWAQLAVEIHGLKKEKTTPENRQKWASKAGAVSGLKRSAQAKPLVQKAQEIAAQLLSEDPTLSQREIAQRIYESGEVPRSVDSIRKYIAQVFID
ncbi:hypothetical protein [Dongshaea marina]|uniref:hypothetical protein n=1 Tax=Dongshaea marina TaxID=2047966 RepID=UPI000D3E8176|nr:hypothetical protein [Dongshaea marina]